MEYSHRGKYLHAKHTEYVCERLEAVETGKLKRLMIFMPPRHSKSMTVTESFPSYFIGRKPDRRVIVVSYSGSLAQRFGRTNKQKIQDVGNDVFGVELGSDKASTTNWTISGKRGGMLSVGLGGSITGEGADLLLIDDPIKNRKEANSVVYRETLWNEWQNTLLTRLQPGGAIIIVLTRWHEDDLAGRLLSEEGHKWEVLRLPCEAEDNDPLEREPGEPLWPSFGYDSKWLDETKKAVGTRSWTSLYQQTPTAQEGEIIKRSWWKFWCHPGQESKLPPVAIPQADGTLIEIKPEPLPERYDMIAQSWDMAFKETDETSFVVGQLWIRKGACSYLKDQVRKRLDFPGTVRMVLAWNKRYPEARAKWVEDKANGPAVISTLKRRVPGLIPIQPDGSKEARLHAVSPEIEAGNVYLPHPQIEPWVNEYMEELSGFPSYATDDQVDATSQALFKLTGKRKGARTLGKKPKGL